MACKGLTRVYMLLAFLLAFYAIFGVNLFSGYQYRACRLTEDIVIEIDPQTGSEVITWPMADFDRLCNSDADC